MATTEDAPSHQVPFEEADHDDYFHSFDDHHDDVPESMATEMTDEEKHHHRSIGLKWPKVHSPFHHGHHKERKAIMKEAKVSSYWWLRAVVCHAQDTDRHRLRPLVPSLRPKAAHHVALLCCTTQFPAEGKRYLPY